MKFPKLLLPISMLMTVFLLTACGKDDDKPAVAAASATACQAGYGYNASYGCLPQGYCPAGYVTYNNQCVAATQQSNNCPAGYSWNGNTCTVSGTGAGSNTCSAYYPGTYPDPNRQGWCTCLPGLRPQGNGCY